jgi:two-component system sensor histidine kinase VanS
MASGRALDVRVSGPDDLIVFTQPELLDLIVDNWIANAFEYAPRRSIVDIVARREDGCCVIEVSNDAPRLGADDMQHLFEPFWRKDEARSGDLHSGLGLSLTKSLAQALGGTVSASLEGSRLMMSLRCAVRADASSPALSYQGS